MRTEIYLAALLVDEELADQVWEAWAKGEISTYWAAWMRWTIAIVEISDNSISIQMIPLRHQWQNQVVMISD